MLMNAFLDAPIGAGPVVATSATFWRANEEPALLDRAELTAADLRRLRVSVHRRGRSDCSLRFCVPALAAGLMLRCSRALTADTSRAVADFD
jgi:hypothetical protein